MFNRIPTLTTSRLTLRPVQPTDAEDLYNFYSVDEITKFYDLITYNSISETQNIIDLWLERESKKIGCRWAILINDQDERPIGTCGFHNQSKDNSRIEIGYELHPRYWNNGYATEACRELIKFGFNELKIHRIEAYIDPKHNISRNVLYKLGMTTEGVLRDYFYERGKYVDAEILSLLNPIKNK